VLGSNELTTDTTDDYEEEEGTEVVKKKTRRMTEAEVRAKDAILAYRKKYTRVPELWAAAEQAAKLAIKNPSHTYPVAGGKVVYGMDQKREFLCCMLPSGRCIRYYKPFIKMIKTKWGKEREEIHFWGEVDHIWSIQKTYGGSLVENFVQGIARDILGNGMLNCEAAGFPLILTVHDEPIAEVQQCRQRQELCGWVVLAKFIERMCDIPKWAAGMPIKAEGWVGLRYKK
jgi:DNA polymerase